MDEWNKKEYWLTPVELRLDKSVGKKKKSLVSSGKDASVKTFSVGKK